MLERTPPSMYLFRLLTCLLLLNSVQVKGGNGGGGEGAGGVGSGVDDGRNDLDIRGFGGIGSIGGDIRGSIGGDVGGIVGHGGGGHNSHDSEDGFDPGISPQVGGGDDDNAKSDFNLAILPGFTFIFYVIYAGLASLFALAALGVVGFPE